MQELPSNRNFWRDLIRDDKSCLVAILLLYGILGAILLQYNRYNVFADQVSFISIAQKYLTSNFTEAINDFCGPLISWLHIPFLVIGLDPLLASATLASIVGGVMVIGVHKLSHHFDLSLLSRRLILIALVPLASKEARDRFGRRAQEHARAHFSADTMVRKYQDLYR